MHFVHSFGQYLDLLTDKRSNALLPIHSTDRFNPAYTGCHNWILLQYACVQHVNGPTHSRMASSLFCPLAYLETAGVIVVKIRCKPVQASHFTCAESNANELVRTIDLPP